MDGWWQCDALEEFSDRVIRADLGSRIKWNFRLLSGFLSARLFNLQSRRRAFVVGERHYDLGNDLFQAMLDRRMIYSCAYWKDARNLDQAQEAKLELVCRKLDLKPRMKVLDIGCGWGGFAKYAAERYAVDMVGVTVSKEQAQLAKVLCESQPVDIRLQDYRDIEDKFDRIVSIGMVEHVGWRNYRAFMKVISRCLRPDGICLLHTICNNKSAYMSDPWAVKYIFPNAMMPSLTQLSEGMENLFSIEDVHNIGPDYELTLLAWHRNFQDARSRLQANYSERFRRMWQYWLLMSAGEFRARSLQVFQIVMSHIGRKQPRAVDKSSLAKKS